MCDLIGCVRLEHCLPPGGEDVVKQAAERGILTRGWAGVGLGQGRQETEAWDPRMLRPSHARPRLFLPYYEACKTLLSENTGGVTGDASSFNFHRMSEIPDTLYMVRDEREGVERGGAARGPLPDQDNVSQMVRRVKKLFRSISVQRALVSPFANRQQILLQLQLR